MSDAISAIAIEQHRMAVNVSLQAVTAHGQEGLQ